MTSDWQRQMAAQRRAEATAARQAARQAEQARKLEYEAARNAEADSRTAEIAQRVGELNSIHTDALNVPPPAIDFDAMKRRPIVPGLELGVDARPISPPAWSDFEPRSPGAVSRAFGGEARYERQRLQAEQDYAHASAEQESAEIARQQRVAAARRSHAEKSAELAAEAENHNRRIDQFAWAVRDRDRRAVSDYFEILFGKIRDPRGFPPRRRAGYVPESSLLAVEWFLPEPSIVPVVKAYKWVKTGDKFIATEHKPAEIRKIYQQLTAQVALRALQIVFNNDPFHLVDTVVFNGMLETIDPVTGQEIEPCLITLRATREQFEPLVLGRLDPVQTIRKHFAADVSAHPDELMPVTPVMEFKMADPRVIDPVDIISRLDTRPNLMELTPKEFEHFIHNLFTRMKFDTQVFKADGDGGVDCVAYDPTPIRGGKYVIQAKLYRKTVPPTAVRDLYGTMQHEGAKSGILITTSGYGPSSYAFITGKPLQLIDGTGLLALCRDHDIPARIVPVAKL